MDLSGIRQKWHLWLEHHPNGHLLLLISGPMFAKPRDFEGDGELHHSKLSWLAPLALTTVVHFWYGPLSNMLADRMILNAKDHITYGNLSELHHALAIGYYEITAGFIALTCAFALLRWMFHGVVCSVMGIARPPLKFFWIHTTGMAVWLSFFCAAMIPLMKQSADETRAALHQFSSHHPWWCLAALFVIYGLMRWTSHNSDAGMRVVYGSQSRVIRVEAVAVAALCALLMFCGLLIQAISR
jgi:hypothetical protein